MSFIPNRAGEQTCNIQFYINDIQQTFIAKLIGRGITLKALIQAEENDSLRLRCNYYGLDTIKIRNSGQEQLKISSVNWISNINSAFSIVQSLVNIPISSDDIKNIILAFNPPKTGLYNATLQIKSNSYKDSVLTIDLVGIKDSMNLLIDKRDFTFNNICSGDTINGSINLENSGEIDYSLNISSSDNISFNKSNISLDAKQSEKLYFSLVNNSSLPEETFQIFIENELCHNIDTINIIVNTIQIDLSVPETIITAKIGSYVDSTFSISNLSNSDIQIDSIIIEKNQFELLNFISGLSIKSNEQKKLQIRFSPVDTTTVISDILIYGQPCGFEKSFTITGRPKFPQTIISIDSIQAKSGDIVRIPLRMNLPENITITDSIEFKTLLSFNKNLLYPLFDNKGIIIANKRYIWLDIKTDLKESGIVQKFKFRAMLGDEESTILKLDSTSTIKGFLEFGEQSGLFTLSDICRQGGDRFIIKSGELTLLQNLPNPAKDITTINYYLNEEGNYDLSLYNSLGNKVLTIAKGYGLIGEYKAILDVSNFSNGTFFYVLRSQSSAVSKLLTVIK